MHIPPRAHIGKLESMNETRGCERAKGTEREREYSLKIWLFKFQYYMYILGGYNTYPQLKRKINDKNERPETHNRHTLNQESKTQVNMA